MTPRLLIISTLILFLVTACSFSEEEHPEITERVDVPPVPVCYYQPSVPASIEACDQTGPDGWPDGYVDGTSEDQFIGALPANEDTYVVFRIAGEFDAFSQVVPVKDGKVELEPNTFSWEEVRQRVDTMREQHNQPN